MGGAEPPSSHSREARGERQLLQHSDDKGAREVKGERHMQAHPATAAKAGEGCVHKPQQQLFASQQELFLLLP